MSRLFEEQADFIDPAEDALKNTPEEEAFRLADSIYPIKANTLREPQIVQAKKLTYKKKGLLDLAYSINKNLSESNIVQSAIDFCEDFNPVNTESNDIKTIWFDAAGIIKFLKWCEPREKDLFNQ